jgi:hypothetical protein
MYMLGLGFQCMLTDSKSVALFFLDPIHSNQHLWLLFILPKNWIYALESPALIPLLALLASLGSLDVDQWDFLSHLS